MSRILLTAAGTGTAFSYITAIAKNFSNIQVFTADTNSAEYITSSLFSEKHFILPAAHEDNFHEKLNNIIEKNNIEQYIPLIDREIYNSFNFKQLKNKTAVNNKIFCKSCLEKNQYENNFSGVGLFFPSKKTPEEINNKTKYILKKNGGFGGNETLFLEGSQISEQHSSYTIYEKIKGKEYTIDCFPIKDTAIVSIRERVEVKNGVCTKAYILKNETLEHAANKLVKKFSLEHPFCFQVIEQESKFYLIDCNPRLGAGSSISAMNGMDFFSAHIAKLIGEDPSLFLSRYYDECIVTRQYTNYLTKVF